MDETKFLVLFLLLLSTAAFVRLWDIERRPAHHDEGNHDFFTMALVDENYHYDPVYHGPFLYHVTAASYGLLGRNLVSLRLPQIIFGIALVMLLFSMREYLGKWGTLTAAALLAVSSSFVYYSRFAIHDSFFAFFTLAVVLCGVKFTDYLLKGGVKNRGTTLTWAVSLGIALGLMFSVKETAYINAAMFGTFIFLAAAWYFLNGKLKEYWDKDRLTTFLLSACAIIAVFVLVFQLSYTSFFRIEGGIPDSMISAVSHWTSTTQSWEGHHKEYTYYVKLMREYDTPMIVLGLLGLAAAAWKGNLFERFLVFWAAAITLGFFYIPYKTPWLIIHILLPYALLAGVFIQRLMDQFKGSKKLQGLTLACLGLMLAYGGLLSYNANFVNPADNDNFLAYVQTTEQIPLMLDKMEEVSKAKTGDLSAEVYMATNEYWPLPFYLRDFTKVNWSAKPPSDGTDATIIIAYKPKIAEVEAAIDTSKYVRKEYELRPGVWLVVFYDKDYYSE